MKLQVRGAGSPAQQIRRLWLKAALALIGPGMLTTADAEPARHLLPGQVITGGRIMQQPAPGGFPDLGKGGIGAPLPFIFPVAVAVSSTRDIYVADAGAGSLFRLDPMLEAMNVIPGVRVSQQTRLSALSDGSIVVANGSMAPVLRINRSGQIIQMVDGQLGGYYDEVVADAASGRYYGLDKIQRRLEEVMPHGRGAMLFPQGAIPEQPTAMAMDGAKIYIAGRVCQCLVVIDTFGSRNMEVMADDAGMAVALAAGEGWLALADGRDRLLRVWRQGALLVERDFATLGVIDPRGMAIAQQTLYIADGAGRRILIFRLRA